MMRLLARPMVLSLCLLMPALGTMGLVGCASSQADDDAARRAALQKDLRATSAAVNAGDLDSAKQYLEKAGVKALTYHEQRQVKSLELLIQGSEAYMAGDPDQAKQLWAKIPDPVLNREVRVKAKSEMNLNIPTH